MITKLLTFRAGAFGVLLAIGCSSAYGQTATHARPSVSPAPSATAIAAPLDYTIGTDDVLSVVFWREPDMSAEVVVRPDGKFSLPLLNDVPAVGLTPDELRADLAERAKRFIADPNVSVVVKQINSRRVFITGNVLRPGPYPLASGTTVLQLIATAGGLGEYADGGKIVIMRVENGQSTSYPFNYNDIRRRRNLQQNIVLRPGDTVLVP